MNTAWYQWQGNDLLLRVRVQPRAAKDDFAGLYGDRLKVRITSPPVDGKANEHLIGFLAQQFGVPKSRITILVGTGNRNKLLRIERPRKLPAEIPPRI